MRKVLGLVLVCAFVAFTAFNAYAEVQNLKVSGDVTASGIFRDLTLGSPAGGAKPKENSIASFARVRFDTDLTDNVGATVRFLNERYWGTEVENTGTSGVNTDISLDLAYLSLKEFLFSPMTLTIGRQELHFGNGMIIGDVDTNNMASAASPFGGASGANNADLSLRKAFDAIRISMDYSPLKLDFVGAKTTEGTRTANDDISLLGVNGNWAVNDNLLLEGYWFDKITAKANAATAGKKDDVSTVGARAAAKISDNLQYQLEGAYQFGTRSVAGTLPSVHRRAFAIESALVLGLPDVTYTPSITVLYSYFSGNRGNSTKQYTAWDPMFEDQKSGDIANTLFPQSNAHIAGLIGTLKPLEDVTLAAEYYLYWWDKRYGENQIITTVRANNLTMTRKKFVGQEVDLKANYDYTEDVQFSLLGGLFLPGDTFNKANNRTASEVIGSMKVSF